MKISIIAFDGVFDTGLSTLFDTFAVANELVSFVDGLREQVMLYCYRALLQKMPTTLRVYPKSPALVKVMKAQAKCKKAW